MWKKYLPYGLILGAYMVYHYIKAGQEFKEKFTVKVHTVKFNLSDTAGALFQKLFFDVVIYIKNPTNFVGQATGSTFQLFYNGTLMGTAQQKGEINLAANAETPVKLSAGISISNLAESVKPIIQKLKSGQQISLQVKGTIETSLGKLTFNQIQNVN